MLHVELWFAGMNTVCVCRQLPSNKPFREKEGKQKEIASFGAVKARAAFF